MGKVRLEHLNTFHPLPPHTPPPPPCIPHSTLALTHFTPPSTIRLYSYPPFSLLFSLRQLPPSILTLIPPCIILPLHPKTTPISPSCPFWPLSSLCSLYIISSFTFHGVLLPDSPTTSTVLPATSSLVHPILPSTFSLYHTHYAFPTTSTAPSLPPHHPQPHPVSHTLLSLHHTCSLHPLVLSPALFFFSPFPFHSSYFTLCLPYPMHSLLLSSTSCTFPSPDNTAPPSLPLLHTESLYTSPLLP